LFPSFREFFSPSLHDHVVRPLITSDMSYGTWEEVLLETRRTILSSIALFHSFCLFGHLPLEWLSSSVFREAMRLTFFVSLQSPTIVSALNVNLM
jgi:hypothetical protein